MTEYPTRLDALVPDDWERSRDVRLRALRDAPDAFGSTLERESGFGERDWRARLERTDAGTFVARDAATGEDVGVAAGARYEGKPEGSAGLFSMWVAPSARGKRVGEQLVERVVAWAREHGYTHVYLDVADQNTHAIGLYERMGFRATGATGSLPPPRDHILEHERVLEL